MKSKKSASPGYAVGANLKFEVDDILAQCASLREVMGDSGHRALLETVEKKLTRAMISISFIGQVKAGKTSLVNSFMGKPDFLPSDINPWTAVITKLFFGKPDGPHQGAEFVFFDDKQWDKLANRGGRLTEIAAEIPESEDKLKDIHEEIRRMQERAMKQLGDKFQALLGKTHRFDNVSTDIIGRYICAGDDPDALVKTQVQGRFADITRSASVFFEKEKFAFPTILVDTPGLNDPLMIREEITIQSLEKSQIFVLVLSAHQAFSSADLYLLRILNSLRLDQLVVFVNRVDELTNPEVDVPAIRKHILSFLRKEMPNANIPVIFGSAACANQAITGIMNVDSKRMKSIRAISRGVKLPKSSTKFPAPQRQSAWLASGLPMLEHAVSEMMSKGPGNALAASAQIDLRNIAIVVAEDAETAICELKNRCDLLANNKSVPSNENRGVNLDIKEFETYCDQLFSDLGRTIEENLNNALNSIQEGIQKITDAFVDTHDKKVAKDLAWAKERSKKAHWACDTSPLRSSLNQYMRKEFPIIQNDLLAIMEKGIQGISLSLASVGLTAAKDIGLNTYDLLAQDVCTSALSRVVAVDMDSSWWKGWISKFMSSEKISVNLSKMIRKQFQPIQTELVEDVRNQLITASDKTITSYRDVLRSMATALANETLNANLASIKEIDGRIEELSECGVVCKRLKVEIDRALAL